MKGHRASNTSLGVIPSAFPQRPWQQALCHTSHIHAARWMGTLRDHPAGVACQCDWIIVSSGNRKLKWGGEGCMYMKSNRRPQVIYVGTRIVDKFAGLVDHLPNKVVIVTGMNDETFPINVDPRYDTSEDGQQRRLREFYTIVNNSNVVHWFIENLSLNHPKVSPLPIGFLHYVDTIQYPHPSPDELYAKLRNASLPVWSSRPVQVLSIDKVRDGRGVWRDRQIAFDLCQKSVFCVTTHSLLQQQKQEQQQLGGTLNHDHFMFSLLQAQFTVMVHGGGLDPCPKLFEALLLGSIPIIEYSPLSWMYELPQFPVAVVSNIPAFLHSNNTQASLALLAQWTKELSPYFLEDTLRQEVLSHLSSDYWWGVIRSKYNA